MRKTIFLLACFLPWSISGQMKVSLPETGISGLYEVIFAASDAAYAKRYFGEYGFTPVDSVEFSETDALRLYGVPSRLKSYRLQNGKIDSHGLLRLWIWEKPLGPGVGYGPPETIGSRMAVMKTKDIMRIYDIYSAARDGGQPWLPTEPIADDLFGLNQPGKNDFFKRPVLVRENAVYGEYFNHVFFQRYGYEIPGYGYINENAPLKTSEFTHHDFFIQADSIQELSYLYEVLGLQPERTPEVDGDWLRGPKRVFMMEPGYSHHYWGFVSPNNICGKLKFFLPRGPKPDRSAHQRPGELGITLHSFYTPKLDFVYQLAKKDKRLQVGTVQNNEFGERCFVFSDTTGCRWQIIEKNTTMHQPVKKLEFLFPNE
ncbi:MAG: hypothetical protein ACOYOO_11005 [Saprospiraceae bacterium]